MPRTGRPDKLTPKMKEDLLKMIVTGNYIETAAAFVGIAQQTLREWIRRGEREAHRLISDPDAMPIKSEEKYLDITQAIKQAQAESEVRDVVLIGRAAQDQWQAAAWRLERRYPDRWGKKERHELTGANGGPVQFEEIRERLLKKITEINAEEHSDRDGRKYLNGASED
jgi:transposase-like protein